MCSQGVDRGCHHSARSTPIRVEVDSDREVTLADGARERLVIQRNWTLEQDWLGAFTAFRAVSDFAGRDSVPRIAKLTTHGELLTRRFCFSLHSILEVVPGYRDDEHTTAQFA